MLGRLPILVQGRALLAERVVAALHRDGRRAALIEDARLARLDPRRIHTLILADPPEPAAAVATLLARTRPRRGGASQRLILMHQADPPPRLPEPELGSPWRLETFSIHDRAARALLIRWPLHLGLDPRFGQRPHLLFAGFADPAAAILVQSLRLIHYGNGRPLISVLGADERATGFLDDYPQAPEIADLRFIPDPAGAAATLVSDRASPAVTLVVVCPGDALAQGLATARQIIETLAIGQGVSPPVLLEVGEQVTSGRIEDWDGQIIPVSYLDEACRAAVLLDGRGDEVARTIHDQYRDSIAAQGRDPSAEPAGQPWERLATSYRQASRHQADHVWAKLAVTDCRAVPEELVDSFALSAPEVERLAIIEHQRWAADRHLDGWRYAPVRDNRLKHHPQLIPYAELSEPMKDLDRFAVRGLPTLLARQGLGVLRQLIVGIPESGGVARRGRRWRRLVDETLDRLIRRYPDRALVLASTLTDPSARELIARALECDCGIGLCVLMPRPLSQTLTALTDPDARNAFLTLLARAERRISLQGDTELSAWLAQRAEISLILGDQTPAGLSAKQVRLDPGGAGLAWGFEY